MVGDKDKAVVGPDSAARASRAAERVARDLAAALLQGRLAEGTLLSPEGELTKSLGCSRTAVRGALRLLESWGLVSVHPGRNGGPVSRHPRPLDLRPGLAALIHSRGVTLSETFSARLAIEPPMAAAAARSRTAAQKREMREVVTLGFASIASRDVFVRCHARFHELVAEAAEQAMLGAFLSALTSISDGTIQRIAPNDESRRSRVLRADERVVAAIERSDPSAAYKAMRAYLVEAERFFRGFAPHLLDSPLRPLAFLDL